MIVFSAIAGVVGLALFHMALAMTLRANPASRIPFARNPAVVPAGSMALRAAGAALLVFGLVMLSTASWYWMLAGVVAGPAAALVIIMIHNRRVASRISEVQQ